MYRTSIYLVICIILLMTLQVNVYSIPSTYTLNVDNVVRINALCPDELKKEGEYNVVFELIALENITVNMWRIDIYAKKYPYLWLMGSYTFLSEKSLRRGEYLKKTISIEVSSNIRVYSDVYIEIYFKYNGSRQIDSEIFVAKIVDRTRGELLEEIERLEDRIENLSAELSELCSELNNVRMSYDYLNISYSKLYGEYTQLYNLYTRLLSNYSLAIEELGVLKNLYNSLKEQYLSLNSSYMEVLIEYNLTRNLLTEYEAKYNVLTKIYNDTLNRYIDLNREYSRLKTFLIYSIIFNIVLTIGLIILLFPKIRIKYRRHY